MNAIFQHPALAADPIALLNTAIIQAQEGNAAAARNAMRAIAAQWTEWDEPWLRLGQSLKAEALWDEAIAAYEEVLARSPHRAEALISLGMLRLQSGDIELAHALLAEATIHHPQNHETWAAFGIILLKRGQAALAADAFHTATTLAPERLVYALDEAEALEACGKADLAEARALERLAANPLDGVAACLAAKAAWKQGDLAEAEALLDVARALLPKEAAPLALLGNLYMLAMQPARAAETLREAQELAPDNFDIAHNRSIALYRLYRFAEADSILTAAMARSAPAAYALCSRATQRAALGDLDSAFEDLDQATRLEPDSINPQRARCTLLAYRANITGSQLRDEMETLSRMLPRGGPKFHTNRLDPAKPLRIGLLSNSLCKHPVGWLTLSGIEALDRSEFSIHCFGQFDPEDSIAKRFRNRAASWDGCETLDDLALDAKIREREIDILIDLGGYGDAGRMEVLAHKPAPVQIKWVGMQCSTTGIPEIDWFITDRWETPEGFEPFYSERLLRLDDGYVCYLPPPYASEVSLLPALEKGHVTFGCFNNLTKFTDGTLSCWAAILQAVPGSRLVLRCPQLSEPSTVVRLRERCEKSGLDSSRLDFLGRAPHRDFLLGYNDIDIALDPFPYSGGLTTCEALYMGVPVITLAGEIFAARHSVSHLSNAGLEEWVAADMPEYIRKTVAFASDLPTLAALRAGMRKRVLASPLCNAPRFGRSLGAGLRRAWEDYCARNS